MARNRNRQAAAGIVIAQEYIGHGLPAALTRPPRLNNRQHVFRCPAGGKRSAVHQHDDGRRSRVIDSLDQVLLNAGEIRLATSCPSPSVGGSLSSSTSFWPWFSPTTTIATSAP